MLTSKLKEQNAVSDALKLARTSTRGGFNLFWGVAVSSVISAVGVMVVAGILEEGQYGLLGIALTLPNLLMIIRDLGIDQATIKYTAQYRHQNKQTEIKNILKASITFEFILGTILSILTYLLAAPIAQLFNRPQITPFIQIASLTIFGQALFQTANSTFIGYEKMQYQSLGLIVQSILKASISIVLVWANFGVEGAILGHTIAYIVAGIFAITLFLTQIYNKLSNNENKTSILTTIKKMLRYGLPQSGAIIMAGLLMQFYAFLIALYLSNQTIANYNLAINFSIIVAFFVQPIQTLLFPAFSKIDGQKNKTTLQNVFRYSVKYSSLLVLPAAFMVMALSTPAVATLFPGKYEQTPLYLSLYIIIYLYTSFGRLSSANLIKSQGRTDINLKLGTLTTIISAILGLILIPTYGILGLMTSFLVSPVPQLLISLWWIKKEYNATINFNSSIRILIASLASAALTYLLTQSLNLPNIILLILGAVTYTISYLVISPLIKAITKEDIKNLKEMLKALGPLGKILNIPLNIIEKIANKTYARSITEE